MWIKKIKMHVKCYDKTKNKYKSQMFKKCIINLSKVLNDQISIMKYI